MKCFTFHQLICHILSGDVMRKYDIVLDGAVCVPDTCSTEKARVFINDYLANADLQLFESHSLTDWCMTDEKPPLEVIDWICM